MIRGLTLSALALVLAACGAAPPSDMASRTMIAETTLPPMKSFAARAPRAEPVSNRALQRDFLDLSFFMESGRELPVFTRFEGPVSVHVRGAPPPSLMPDLRALLKRLRTEAGITLTLTDSTQANITIEAVPRRAIQKVLPQAACFVAPNVSSLSEFRGARRAPKTNWATLETRKRLVIVIPRDVSPQEIRDCLHEELAQALGPLNDLYHLPNSVFNDDNVHTVLTNFDMLILAATYAPELRSGMTRAEVQRALPQIFARLNPGGESLRAGPATSTPQSYIKSIQTALGPGSSEAERRAAAQNAVRIAETSRWNDNRLGFAYYALGRVLQPSDTQASYDAYRKSDSVYAASRATQLHRAFVATHLAAYALASGDPALANRRIGPHVARARDAQNAALLATLQMIRAEALRAQGRIAEANAERLDSLGWARYGFGADWAVDTKLREISALTPSAPPV